VRTLVIGDVHGCSHELDELLALAEFDEVVFVGDLVRKGPDSAGVVHRARELGARAVRGNHDHILLCERPDDAGLSGDDWRWLESLPLVIRLPEHHALVVHGGFMPDADPEGQDPELLMNMRSILASGAPSRSSDEGVAWASRWSGPEHVYFGHDTRRGLQIHPFATGLDTGCVYGGRLTGAVLPAGDLVSVPSRQPQFTVV
jgi:predicted phosphodiesterase